MKLLAFGIVVVLLGIAAVRGIGPGALTARGSTPFIPSVNAITSFGAHTVRHCLAYTRAVQLLANTARICCQGGFLLNWLRNIANQSLLVGRMLEIPILS
jgi:hypothetical protein